MSRKNSKKQQPGIAEQLLQKGRVQIAADSREQLMETLDTIPDGILYSCGAVAKNSDTGKFTIIITTY